MSSIKIQNLPTKTPIGAMKIPTGGFGDFAITVKALAAWVQDIVSALGVNQTYVNVTSSRYVGNTYRNTSGSPMQVSITSTACVISVSTNAIAWVVLSPAIENETSFSFIVPDSMYYKITGGTFSNWVELS